MASPTNREAAPPIAALVGPTGSGKSDLAMALAAHEAMEILVADSRQVYRGMDVGSAKPRRQIGRRSTPPPGPGRSGRALHPGGLAGTPLAAAARDRRAGAAAARRRRHRPVRPRARRRLRPRRATAVARRRGGGWSTRWRPRAWLRSPNACDDSAPEAAERTDLRNARRVLRALERVEAQGGGAWIVTAAPYPGQRRDARHSAPARGALPAHRGPSRRHVQRRPAGRGARAAGIADTARSCRP